MPCGTLLVEIMDLVLEDAEALGCIKEIEHLGTIMETGTSAHRQLSTYSVALSKGASQEDALKEVVDMLIDETKDIG